MGNKAKKGRKKVNNIQKSILKTFGLTMVFQGKIKHTYIIHEKDTKNQGQ